MIGTPLVIGFNLASQRSLDEKYLKNGVAFADEAEVLTTIPVESRSPGLLVKIGTVLYWFLDDLTTLEPVVGTLTLSDGSVTLVKMANVASGTVFYRKTSGSGIPEVQTLATLRSDLAIPAAVDITGKVDKITGKGLSTEDFTTALKTLLNQQSNSNSGDETEATILAKLGVSDIVQSSDLAGLLAEVPGYSLVADTEIDRLLLLKQNPYQINLPAGDLTTKIAGATFLPAGWATIAMDGTTNAMITHVLTGRKVSFVNVFEIDGSDESLLSFDKGTAYTGIKGNGLTVFISGIAPTTLPVRIELIFD